MSFPDEPMPVFCVPVFSKSSNRSGLRGAYGELRVLDERKDDGLHCRHSTPAYPGWMLASTASLSQEAARAITAVLLTKPANAWGQHWTVSPNVEAYDDLFRTLRIGPYAYLREWTLARIWSEWKAAIINRLHCLRDFIERFRFIFNETQRPS